MFRDDVVLPVVSQEPLTSKRWTSVSVSKGAKREGGFPKSGGLLPPRIFPRSSGEGSGAVFLEIFPKGYTLRLSRGGGAKYFSCMKGEGATEACSKLEESIPKSEVYAATLRPINVSAIPTRMKHMI